MAKKKEVKLTVRDKKSGKIVKRFTPGIVLELCTDYKEQKKDLVKLSKQLDEAGFASSGIWETTHDNQGYFVGKKLHQLVTYTLCVYLPEGISVKTSKFDKKIWDKFQGKDGKKKQGVKQWLKK